MPITSYPKLNGVIGFPLDHSLGPVIHNALYQHFNIDALYEAFPHPDIATLVARIKTLPLHLTAVTMPHKESIMTHLESIDPIAKKIGAVNTVLNRGGELTGFNTDLIGIQRALSGINLKGKTVLLLGAGGAARPVTFFINQQQGTLLCLNRTPAAAERLTVEFGGRVVTLDQVNPEAVDLIINATSVGMDHASDMPLPVEFLQSHHVVFDLIYSHETALLKHATTIGARTISGRIMFIAQACEQFQLWTERKFDEGEVTHVITKALTPVL